MDKAVKTVLDNFVGNRKIAEEAVLKKKPVVTAHKHGLFCFPWSGCRELERSVKETEERIKKYKEAEKGIRDGDYSKAIDLLEEIAKPFEETPWQVAMRAAFSPGTISSIMNSPTAINYRLTEMRKDLISFQKKFS